MAAALPWLPVLCGICPDEILHSETLFGDHSKITLALNLPILQDLLRYVDPLWKVLESTFTVGIPFVENKVFA